MSPTDITTPFGWPIILYLALAGLSCGAAITGVWFARSSTLETKALVRPALWLAAVAIGLGSLLLVEHLAVPSRTYLLFIQFNPSSAVAWGVRLITIFILLCAFAALLFRPDEPSSFGPTLQALIILFALAIGIYPAFVLLQGIAHPFWGSALLIPLFLVTGFHSGFAAVQLIAPRDWLLRTQPFIRKLDLAFVAVSVSLFAWFLLTVPLPDAGKARIISGDLAAWFWIGLVAVGWLLPLAASLRASNRFSEIAVRQACFLVGALALRVVVVSGGQGASAFIGA